MSDKKSKDMNTNLKYHITLIPMTFHLSENICGQIVPVITAVKKETNTTKTKRLRVHKKGGCEFKTIKKSK